MSLELVFSLLKLFHRNTLQIFSLNGYWSLKTLQRSNRVWSRLLAFTLFRELLVFNLKFLESIYYITIPRLTKYADVTYCFEPVYFFLPPQLIWNLKLYAYRFKAKKKINFVITSNRLWSSRHGHHLVHVHEMFCKQMMRKLIFIFQVPCKQCLYMYTFHHGVSISLLFTS